MVYVIEFSEKCESRFGAWNAIGKKCSNLNNIGAFWGLAISQRIIAPFHPYVSFIGKRGKFDNKLVLAWNPHGMQTLRGENGRKTSTPIKPEEVKRAGSFSLGIIFYLKWVLDQICSQTHISLIKLNQIQNVFFIFIQQLN